MKSWIGQFRLPRHRKSWMRGAVICEGDDCGKRLGYEYGSIAWNCHDRDLCPECAAKEAAARIREKMSAR